MRFTCPEGCVFTLDVAAPDDALRCPAHGVRLTEFTPGKTSKRIREVRQLINELRAVLLVETLDETPQTISGDPMCIARDAGHRQGSNAMNRRVLQLIKAYERRIDNGEEVKP